ncbi:hypothetical protein NQ314_018825 [Rhamnusium bicolor]|uniref:Uncharacterized protein n=1 Tax=Rhamnusium bicolor TaxID=1586634 RepID=A0AAV8WQ09_9CUCU|nr:hypothetical protein NQ314_018825 [Rhamnusium bicolor]
MENEQWTAKYQQSVPTNLERTANNLNNGNTEHHAEDLESSKNAGKDESENQIKAEPNLDSSPANITIRLVIIRLIIFISLQIDLTNIPLIIHHLLK